MLHIKTYIFNHFYLQYLVLLTMVPRNNIKRKRHVFLKPSNTGFLVEMNVFAVANQVSSRPINAEGSSKPSIVGRDVGGGKRRRQCLPAPLNNQNQNGPADGPQKISSRKFTTVLLGSSRPPPDVYLCEHVAFRIARYVVPGHS